MAKLANKRIYIIKETASRERHTEKNTSAIDNAKASNKIICTRYLLITFFVMSGVTLKIS